MTDLQNVWLLDVDVAYRRRLAYTLAFEASIHSGSLDVYKRYYPVLSGGSLADLQKVLPPMEEAASFSIYLNLVDRLDEAYTRQVKGTVPTSKLKPLITDEVVDYASKRRWLAEKLTALAKTRKRSLNNDGKIAINALLYELNDFYQRQFHYIYLPVWGATIDPEIYHALKPDDQVHIADLD